MSLLQIDKLTMRFGGLVAVDAVTLEIPTGKIVSLIGPNGAGKTTVFNAITGIYEPTAGRIVFNGQETRSLFRWTTGVALALVSLITAAAGTLLVNAESLWETAITANYQYRQTFDWATAAGSARAYFAASPASRLVWPFLAGALVGAAGAWAVWQRSRRAPEIAARTGIARTFQNIRLFNQMTVLDNVLLGMDTGLRSRVWHAALRLPFFWRERREAAQRAMEMLRFVGLEQEVNQLAENLAYGHQRRLEIARALAMNPRLLLLDEPAAGLNPAESRDLMALIHRIRDRGITVFLIEHDMQVVMGISDRVAVLDYGEKIAEGTPAEVRTNPVVIEAYLESLMLQIENVHAGYGPVDVLKGISLTVADGEIVAVLGANGAGKSTMLMTICGVNRCRHGSMTFAGQPIQKMPPHEIVRRGISQVPEGRRIFPRLTVRENLEMGAFHRRDGAEDLAKVFALFPILKERQSQFGGTLSGGEQQMLAISRALMARPKLLLLDEPSLGLAPMIVAQIFEIIRAINREGTTILLVEQNANMALHVAHRGYVLETGRIVLQDTAKNLMNNEAVRKSYLGG